MIGVWLLVVYRCLVKVGLKLLKLVFLMMCLVSGVWLWVMMLVLLNGSGVLSWCFL